MRTVENIPTKPPISNKTLYVKTFTDARNGKNVNHAGRALIPFVPVAGCTMTKPEADEIFLPGVGNFEYDVNVPVELAEATVFSFQTAGTFAKAELQSIDNILAGYTLTGTIYDYGAKHHALTYGLSVFVGFAYIFAAPAGTATNRIDIEFTLSDNSSGTTIWKERFRKKETFCYTGLYYNREPNGRFPKVFAQIMARAIAHASTAVQQYERTNRMPPQKR